LGKLDPVLTRRIRLSLQLPIGSATLKYGSADGGFTIASDKGFSKKMKQVANVLVHHAHTYTDTVVIFDSHLSCLQNLKGHYVKERKTSTLKLMYGPVDIEGHIGLDGRYYCVDTARVPHLLFRLQSAACRDELRINLLSLSLSL
jgi:hypothetical protein